MPLSSCTAIALLSVSCACVSSVFHFPCFWTGLAAGQPRTSRLLRIRVSDDALDVMRRDALRRKIPYSQVMGEALERHAAELSGNSESG